MFLCLCARALFCKSRAAQLIAAVRETRWQCWKSEQFCPDPVGTVLEQQPPLSGWSCSHLPFSPCRVKLSSSVQSWSLCKQMEAFSRELLRLFSCLESGDAAPPCLLVFACSSSMHQGWLRSAWSNSKSVQYGLRLQTGCCPLALLGQPWAGQSHGHAASGDKEGRASTSTV